MTTTTTNENQKAGQLTGGSASAEALASSAAVLRPTRSGNSTGLQQFYTPPAVAEFIAAVLDMDRRCHTLDLTAGDGSLLAPWEPGQRVGVELDSDQIRAAKKAGRPYRAVQGDVQHVYPLLRVAGLRFACVVLNPPFGLEWQAASVNGGKKGGSARLALLMGLGLLTDGGQGAIIGGTERLEKEFLWGDDEIGRAIYAVADLPAGTFPGVSLPVSVAFFGDPTRRKVQIGPGRGPQWRRTVDMDNLTEDIQRIGETRALCFDGGDGPDPIDPDGLPSALRTIQDEHARRRDQRAGKAAQDVCLGTGGKLSVSLSPLAQTGILEAKGYQTLAALRRLHGQRVNYFALNGREWRDVQALADAGLLTIDVAAQKEIEAVVRANAATCPVYPVKPQQRLGYLADTENIECTRSDSARGFVQGRSYPVAVSSRIARSERKQVKEIEGRHGKEVKELTWVRKAKVLDITLTPEKGYGPLTLSESKEDIEYLLAHFALPDPGDLAAHFPAEMENRRDTLRMIEADTWQPRGFQLKDYQREDLARLLLKTGGVLSWEQGLGKSNGALMFAEACARRGETDGNALFIVPQDLIPQWQAEAEKFFGRELVWLKTRAEARQVAKRIAAQHAEAKRQRTAALTDPDSADPFYDIRDSGAWYITHYEALSLAGTTGKATVGSGEYAEAQRTERGRVALPVEIVREVVQRQFIKGGYRNYAWYEDEIRETRVTVTTEDLCPSCWRVYNRGTDTDSGWDGRTCRVCGYSHTALRLHPMAHELTTAFKSGVIVVDEATKIKGDSLQGLAVRGLRARRKLILTGTPVKNFVVDLFHLLGWALGYSSPRFPFAHAGGLDKFKKDFCVIESLDGKSAREKVLPEVTNLSVLWKMLSSSIVRRRKEDTGEPLAARTFYPVTVPFGTKQRAQYSHWLNGFSRWYCQMNPDADPVTVELNSAILGQLHKLEYSTTLPTADPDAEYWRVGVSDWTPKTLKVLELAAQHAARGENVLVGSDVKLTGRLLADALAAKGIPAAHILEETAGGVVTTKAPAARAGAVQAFKEGKTRILCAGVQSINLGHNLDCASVVILDGLPWDYATIDQFLARVHRLTSTHPVKVYVVMTEGSLDERKWKLLQEKGKSADLTLDGELSDKDQKPVNLQDVIRDLQRRGLPASGTVDEDACRALWQRSEYALQPVGYAWTPEGQAEAQAIEKQEAEAQKPAETPAPTLPLHFTFAPILPKTKKARNAPAIASMFETQVRQGCLFAL